MHLLSSGGPLKDARKKKHNCSARPEYSSYRDRTCDGTKATDLQRTVGSYSYIYQVHKLDTHGLS